MVNKKLKLMYSQSHTYDIKSVSYTHLDVYKRQVFILKYCVIDTEIIINTLRIYT